MEKHLCGAIASLLALLAPVRGLIVCAILFIGVDFLIGLWADYRRAKTACRPWAFESRKAWATVTKLALVMGGIVMAWLIDAHILPFLGLQLAKIFTGFVCGVEFWSYLENASEISDRPLFRALRRLLKRQLDRKLDIAES